MDFKQMSAFVAVAEELHFSHAAKRLGMTQPHLSRQIASLEREIGALLLARDRRNVELTRAGRIFLEDCREILERIKQATEKAASLGSRKVVPFRIGVKSNAASATIGDAVSELAAIHRDFQFRFVDNSTEALIRDLLQRKLDVVFGIGDPTNAKLEVAPLFCERVSLLASARIPAVCQRPVSLKRLAERPWLLCARKLNVHVHDKLREFLVSHGVPSEKILETDSPETIQSEVAADLAYSFILPSWAKYLRPNLAAKGIKEEAPEISTFLAWRRHDTRPCLADLVRLARQDLRRPSETAVKRRPKTDGVIQRQSVNVFS